MTAPASSTPLPVPRPAALTGNLMGVASMVVWALGFPAAEMLIGRWPALSIVTGRYAMAIALLIPLMLVWQGIPRGMPWLKALVIGGIGFGGGATLLLVAQAATDPVTAAVITAISPLTGTLVEWATDRVPLGRPFLIGLVLSVVGGVVATSGGVAPGGNLALGLTLGVLSCVLFSWGSHQTVRSLPGQTALAQATVTATGGFLAVLGALAVSGLLAQPVVPPSPQLADLGYLALYGAGGLAISQILWLGSVRYLGVGLASFHINLAPFYVMLAMLVWGGEWSWRQAIGAAIVAGGVLVAQRRA